MLGQQLIATASFMQPTNVEQALTKRIAETDLFQDAQEDAGKYAGML